MRALLRLFDAFLGRSQDVFAFSDQEDCLLRLQIRRAVHDLEFPDQRVERGEPVLALHLWNEHLPVLPPEGADLVWASRLRRLFLRSLNEAAQQFDLDPRLTGVRAVGGNTALLAPDSRGGGARLMERLGFKVFPLQNPAGRFAEWWEALYARLLIWTYNPASLRGRPLGSIRRSEFWMPADEFVRRFGKADRGASPE